MPVEVPVEQSISSTSEEEQLKSSDTTASRPAKSSDKEEDLRAAFRELFKNHLLFRFILKFFRRFRTLLVIANNIHRHIEVLLFSTSFVISLLFGDVKTEKIGSFCVTGR